MDIILLIIVFCAGYFVGKMKAYITFAREMKDAAKSLGIDLEKELVNAETPKKLVYKLAVEQHGEMLYLFDKEEDSFICQGKTVQELATLAKQYNNIMHAAVLYGDKVFQFKDGESSEVV